LEEAHTLAAEMGIVAERASHLALLSEAMVADRRYSDALRVAEIALEFARTHRERGYQGWILRITGEIYATLQPPEFEKAEAQFRDALAIAEELGMRPLQAHTHLSLGKLYRRAGRDHEARSELNVAIDLYLSMEMTHWLPEAEAELAAINA
jgi:tetratricopeptide (TPR) repeat protein